MRIKHFHNEYVSNFHISKLGTQKYYIHVFNQVPHFCCKCKPMTTVWLSHKDKYSCHVKKRLDLVYISIFFKWKYAFILKFRTHVYTVSMHLITKYCKSQNQQRQYMYLVPLFPSPPPKKEKKINIDYICILA